MKDMKKPAAKAKTKAAAKTKGAYMMGGMVKDKAAYMKGGMVKGAAKKKSK